MIASTVAVVGIASLAVFLVYSLLRVDGMLGRDLKLMEELVMDMKSRLSSVENDIRRLKVAMEDNENSHGVLSMMIQEISATEKIGELRKEVLRMKEEE